MVFIYVLTVSRGVDCRPNKRGKYVVENLIRFSLLSTV
jgi:hypothetical protein